MRLARKVAAILILHHCLHQTSGLQINIEYRGTRRLQMRNCRIMRKNMKIFGHQSETQNLSLLPTPFHFSVTASLHIRI